MEDRPTDETVADDDLFDKWLEAFERKMAKESAKIHKVKPDMMNNG